MATVKSISADEAFTFLGEHKRHYNTGEKPIAYLGLFDVGMMDQPNDAYPMVGAAILGEVAPRIGCVAHIYVDGTFQGYSLLYGQCWRALHALGYEYAKL